MRTSRRLAGLSLGVAVALGGSLALPPLASASSTEHAAPHQQRGTTSLASVLLADKNGFDNNPHDYDVLTAAVLAVVKAKPHSKVGVLTDGNVAVTAFLPDDQAFRVLVHDLTGRWLRNEKDVFAAVASLGIDTVEKVLLYHVVPGATITKKTALTANGAKLTTAEGGTITVRVHGHGSKSVTLVDADPKATNSHVVSFDINKGNRQIAHGLDLVLRPVPLT